MAHDRYRVRIPLEVKASLRRIGRRYGKKTYEVLRDLICDLAFEPHKKGDPLRGPLLGLHSRHYSRFRIVYQINRGEAVVLVVGTGFHESKSRDDIYKLLERALESGKLVIQKEPSPDK